MKVFVEDTAGDQFECDIPADTKLSDLAADFFNDRDWPTTDNRGRGNRAVVELVDTENPDHTKRLRGEQTVEDAGLWDGCVLRIFPESIAGVVDERERIRALVADHQDMQDLVSWNPHIKFEPNASHAPTRYIVTFDYRSFSGLEADGHTPQISTEHRVEIILGADYPRRAPMVRWLTPIFHPNISPETGAVCLGVIMDRYLPGLGLARLVTMLAEMVQYRNFDMSDALNRAAAEWTLDTEHWKHIEDIGGSPFQGPVHELFKDMEKSRDGEGKRTRIKFKHLSSEGNS
jgi:ubiquitin-protein ligase